MKLKKLLLITSPIVLTTGLVPTSITSCSNKSAMPKVSSHETKKVLIKSLRQRTDGTYFYADSQYGKVEVHTFNDLPMAYINVDDYVTYLMKFADNHGGSYINYSSETKDKKTVITNDGNNATATIDYDTQIITFSDCDMFCCNDKNYLSNPLAEGAGGGEDYYIKDTTGSFLFDSKYVSGGEYKIDLTKYSIKAFYHQNKGYLPMEIFRNIFNRSSEVDLFYNGVALYEICNANSTNVIDLYKPVAAEATILTTEYMEYCYNMLALTLDNKFGLTERLSRAPESKGQIIKYFPNGAYEALEPYKEDLTSLDAGVANDAMFRVFRDLADDGGHAGYNGVNLLSKDPHISVRGPQKTQTFDVQDMVENSRQLARLRDGDYVAPVDYWVRNYPYYFDSNSAPDNYMKLYTQDSGEKPILYITFDAFNHVEGYTTYEEVAAGHVRYDDVTYASSATAAEPGYGNYYLDTVRMTMGADKFIRKFNEGKEEKNQIKDIVLDLSNNGGGTVYTEHFIASWLCGGVTEKIWNPKTKAYAEYTIKANVNNNDNVFDEKDYLSSDTNVYCITSDTSFSCGNMLPCNLVDNRSTDHTFYIGSASGGGACFVDSNMHIGLGNGFRSSSTFHMLRGSSTKDKPVSVESGHLDENDASKWFYQIASTWADAEKFCDRITINQKIRARV